MIELIGYSYPFATLKEVVEAEARQGRKVAVVIKHAGGWAVSEGWGCTCLEYQGDNKDCPVHSEPHCLCGFALEDSGWTHTLNIDCPIHGGGELRFWLDQLVGDY